MLHTLIRSFNIIFILLLMGTSISAQNKKVLTPDNYKTWNRIKDVKIAPNGSNVIYTLSGERTNKSLYIYNTESKNSYNFPRVKQPTIDYNGDVVIWKSIADVDTTREMKRREVDKSDMPGDSLSIFDMKKGKISVMHTLKSFKTPE